MQSHLPSDAAGPGVRPRAGEIAASILRGATPITRLAWLGFMVVALVAAARGHRAEAVVAMLGLALVMLPPSLPALARIALPPRAADALTLFFVATLGLGEVFDFYHRFRPWDWMLHAGAGFAAALAGAVAVLALTGERAVRPGAGALVAAALSIAFGTGWELFEFSLDVAFGLDTQKGFSNTMLDLVANTAGAAIGAVLVRGWLAGAPERGPTRVLGDFARMNPRLWKR
jgi:hypothetical protein